MSRPAASRRRSPLRNLLLFPWLAGNSRGGLGLAAQQRKALVWFMGLGLWTALGGGCVTDTIPFDQEPIEPPDILDSPTSPRATKIGKAFIVDSSMSMMWPMQVLVREKDPTRKLFAHVRIYPATTNLLTSPPPFDPVVVPMGNVEDPELRELSFNVRTNSLKPDTCHRLELVVSGSFREKDVGNFFFDIILDENRANDIDSAVWQVWEGDASLLMEGSEAAAKVLASCGAEVLMPDMSPSSNGDTR